MMMVGGWWCGFVIKRYFDEENYGNTSLESESDGLGGAEGNKLKKKKEMKKKKKKAKNHST